MSMKDDYFAMMVSRFKRWDAEFGMLSERDESGNAAEAGQHEQLRSMRNATYRKLQEIRMAGESGWRGMQSVVDAAWVVMRTGLDRAMSQARK